MLGVADGDPRAAELRRSHAAQKVGPRLWGVGPLLLLPTATNDTLGAEKFGVGPTAVVLIQPGKWTFGLLANQMAGAALQWRPERRIKAGLVGVHAAGAGAEMSVQDGNRPAW